MNYKILTCTLIASSLLLSACGNSEEKKVNSNSNEVKTDVNKDKNSNLEKEFKDKCTNVESEKFDQQKYKHEENLKITDAKIVALFENELGIQEATIVTNDDNNVVTGTYTALNYTDTPWATGERYTYYGTYDLKHEDVNADPSIDVKYTEKSQN